MPDKTSKLILQWAVAGAQPVQASLELTTRNVRHLQAALDTVNRAAGTTFNGMSREVRETTADYDAMLKKTLQVESTLKRLSGIPAPPSPIGGIGDPGLIGRHGAREAGSGSMRSALGRIGSELRQLPSTAIPGTGLTSDAIANMLRVGGAIQEVATNFGTLLPILGAVGLAVGAFAAALAFLSARNEESARTTRTLMGLTEQYYRLALSGTQEQIRAAVEEVRLERDIAQARLDFNRSILDQIDQSVGTAGRAVADIFNLSGAKELREQTQLLEGQLLSSSFAVNYLSSLLDENAAAAERAAAANERLIDASNNFTLLQEQRELDTDIETARELAGLTVANALERREAWQEERDMLVAEAQELDRLRGFFEHLVNDPNTPEDRFQWAVDMLERLDEANRRINALNLDLIPETEALVPDALVDVFHILSGGVAGISPLIDDFRDRNLALAASMGEVMDATAALEATQQEHAAKVLVIDQRLNDALIEAAYDRDRALEDAAYDANRRREEIEQEAQDARLELAEDTERKRQQIERRFSRAMLDAVGDRDALAAYQAEQQRADALAELEASHDEQLDTIKKRLEDQHDAIDRGLQDQQRTIQRRYEDQLRTANLAHQRALQQEQARWTAELNLRQQALIFAQQQLANALAIEQALRNQGYTAALESANSFVNAFTSLFSGGDEPERHIVIPDTIFADPGDFLQLAGGGRFGAGQSLIVGEHGPEAVMFDRSGYVASHPQTQAMMNGASGGVTIPITINGASKQQILREVWRELDGALTQAEVA